MAEEVSPESKVYVKEEIDKMRKEFKEDLKEANSKATKIFATIALIVGLLGSLGIYGWAEVGLRGLINDETRDSVIAEVSSQVKNFEKKRSRTCRGT